MTLIRLDQRANPRASISRKRSNLVNIPLLLVGLEIPAPPNIRKHVSRYTFTDNACLQLRKLDCFNGPAGQSA